MGGVRAWQEMIMTTICPNCDARFRDPPPEIPIERPLQCSKCEHEWVRDPEAAPHLQVVDAPLVEPTMQSLLDNPDDAIRTNLPMVVAPTNEEPVKRGPIYVDREPEIQPKKKSLVPPALALVAVAAIAGAISLKDLVVEHVPQARSAYTAAGLISPAPDLKIAGMQTTKTTKDGIRQLIIRGEIENKASHEVPVPSLKLTMRGESNVRLYAWTVSAAKDQLKAGERSRFTAIAHDYPGDAVDVEVEFMPLDKPKE